MPTEPPAETILETVDGFRYRTVRESPHRITCYVSFRGSEEATMTYDTSKCRDGKTVDDLPLENLELIARNFVIGTARALKRMEGRRGES